MEDYRARMIRVKMAERGSARAAEQDFTTPELMLSGPLAEPESSVDTNVSTFSGAKVQEQVGCAKEEWGPRVRDWGHSILKQTHS